MKNSFILFLFYGFCILYAKTPKYDFTLTSIMDTSIKNNNFYMWEEKETDYQEKLGPKYEKIVTDLAYIQVMGIASIGVISLLPDSITNWDASHRRNRTVKDLLGEHAKHLQSAPVVDEDDFSINYIGHPLAGSYYYVWGRQSGLSWQESFVLTTMMSTFFWEYGWEAFAEIPSIQDLISTPVLGALLGEGSNYLYNKIIDNNGLVYNSKILGSLGKIVLNPIGEINDIFAYAFDTANIDISVDYSYVQEYNNYNLRNMIENNGHIQSYFKLKFNLKY